MWAGRTYSRYIIANSACMMIVKALYSTVHAIFKRPTTCIAFARQRVDTLDYSVLSRTIYSH
jgi:hypothetical protein